jgi:O-antigen/teichoic acid export membrane protein
MLLVGAVIGFFMMPFLVHRLGDKLFGLWALVGSFSGTYAVLDLGLAAAVGRYVAMYIGKNDYESVNVYINTALVIYCMMGVIVVLATFGLTNSVYRPPHQR